MNHRIRFDPSYFQSKPKDYPPRVVVESGLEYHKYKVRQPPQRDARRVPPIVDNRDAKAECLLMLETLRRALAPTLGATMSLSMRSALECIQTALNPQHVERFIRLYETVLFGSHRISAMNDSDYREVSVDDLKFMHAYFYNTIMKEL